ncbi:nucleotidyltransferase [Malonomonas rubra]|uniref:nucleotidyltransferase n=1 Tax=Malonomonas rubra TaxID=57040 RepID=UPI0026F2F320|nr:nucleotidyltransferase [Malonomonas rubra]
MRAVGLITEYNPFHNGHLHHLRESLKASDARVAVAVMSGHFLQRGEPALIDKWSRAEMALAAGVDLVVELPLPWACSSAPDFAQGGVQALNALGRIDALCFGSESGQLQPLRKCAELLLKKNEDFAERTAQLLREGINYPQARAKLLTENLPDMLDAGALAAPNNILGIEYLKALQRTGSSIEPMTIQRIGAGYHDTEVGERNIASATGIRSLLAAGKAVDDLIPAEVIGPLHACLAAGARFVADRYFALLLAQILRAPERLAECWLVENGIENRLLEAAEVAGDLEELIDTIKTRQLTRTRIQRMLVSILLGIDKPLAVDLLAAGPRYLHLLGVSGKGEQFLAETRRQRSIPLVQNFSRVHSRLKRFYGIDTCGQRLSHRQLELELRATKLYSLLQTTSPGGSRNRDFFEEVRRPQQK